MPKGTIYFPTPGEPRCGRCGRHASAIRDVVAEMAENGRATPAEQVAGDPSFNRERNVFWCPGCAIVMGLPTVQAYTPTADRPLPTFEESRRRAALADTGPSDPNKQRDLNAALADAAAQALSEMPPPYDWAAEELRA